jgi:serine protease Do
MALTLVFAMICASCGTPQPLNTPDIVEKMTPSTVLIRVNRSDKTIIRQNPETRSIEAVKVPNDSSGSGIALDDGYIITNAHVVDGYTQVTVSAPGKERNQPNATFVGISPCDDIAVFKSDNPKGLTPATLGDSDKLRVGEDVIAMGYPLGENIGIDPTVTQGIISQLHTTVEGFPMRDLIQTDAAINPGNSGGPLINRNGEVIGINTLTINATIAVNISQAISINQAKKVIDELKQSSGGKLRWLGMSLRELNINRSTDIPYYLYYDLNNMVSSDGSFPERLFVESVEGGSPASKIGVHAGDLLLTLKGNPVASNAQVCDIMQSSGEGALLSAEFGRRNSNQFEYWSGEISISKPDQGTELKRDDSRTRPIEELTAGGTIADAPTPTGAPLNVDQPTSPPTAAPQPTRAPPPNTPTPSGTHLAMRRAREDEEPTCIAVQILGILPDNWTVKADGIAIPAAQFDGAGKARLCKLKARQQFTFTIYNAQGGKVPGGGSPARGGDVFEGNWQ